MTQPGVRGGIEHPQSEQDHWGSGATALVDGWALVNDQLPNRVQVLVDGTPYPAQTGLSRPDVATSLGHLPGIEDSGFAALVPLRARRHELSVQAADQHGTWHEIGRRTVRRPRKPRSAVTGALTAPVEGRVVSDRVLNVEAWVAVTDASPTPRAVLALQGRPITTLEAVTRLQTDLQTIHSFQADVEVPIGEGGGELQLVLIAVFDDTSFVLDEQHVDIAPIVRCDEVDVEEARPEIRLPLDAWFGAPRTDSVERSAAPVSGWVQVGGSMASSAEVIVGNDLVVPARLGISTMALSDALEPDAVAVGFEAMVDMSLLPDDVTTTQISVRAVGLDGTVVEVDGPEVDVMPVTVDPEPLARAEAEAVELRAARALLLSRTYPMAPTGDPDVRHILVYTHDMGLGGGQLYIWELLERMSEIRPYHFTIVAERSGPLMKAAAERGWETHVTGTYSAPDPWSMEGHFDEFAAWTASRGFEAVIVNSLGSFIGVDIASALGLPSLWAIHESFSLNVFEVYKWGAGVAHPWLTERLEGALGRAQRLIFEADATREMFEQYTQPGRALTVPYGIQMAGIEDYRIQVDRAELRRELGLATGQRMILVMGTTEPRKAQTTITRAFAELSAEFPDTHLVIVGDTGGEYGRAVRALVERHGLDDRVTVVGLVKDTYRYYHAADLFLTASDIESLPRSVIEVMAFGVPVLATRIFGLPELITDDDTGWLCAAGDLRALIDRMRDVLRLSDHECQAVGERGRVHVRERHDSTGYARDYDALLTELLDSTAGTAVSSTLDIDAR